MEGGIFMKILATYKHNMGGVFKLAKVSDDFYMYGTQKEFDSFWGVSVDRCGTRDEVLSHCLRIAEICSENIEKYKKSKEKDNKIGLDLLIADEQSEKNMLLFFAETLRTI